MQKVGIIIFLALGFIVILATSWGRFAQLSVEIGRTLHGESLGSTEELEFMEADVFDVREPTEPNAVVFR
ncbi:hypothetical protein ADIS_2865 [Lunatimonas lonarensis]|uniref:Uncharacterized protein n=1 Tax=Lunatimonas lonarensis TaxID=1232681 RepID=R7ZQM3_9BACT|nr:hypothetical protein [Lunatimonas lonarensis]EON76415.1 hypothetical protein ADIS_2865 [Lunatimonas lonarensis]